MPIKNLKLSSDLTYQNFSKGQQFEYISADQIDKVNLNTDIKGANNMNIEWVSTIRITQLLYPNLT